MKKYLLGIFAIGLVVGFSAFTTSKVTHSKISADYYWYPVNEAGQTTGASFNASTPRDKTYAMSFFTNCSDATDKPYCILGSSINNLTTGSTISSPAGDATVLKTN